MKLERDLSSTYWIIFSHTQLRGKAPAELLHLDLPQGYDKDYLSLWLSPALRTGKLGLPINLHLELLVDPSAEPGSACWKVKIT